MNDHKQTPEQFLGGIKSAAEFNQVLKLEFGENPPPEIEMLLSVHRCLVMNYSTRAEKDPSVVGVITDLMKTLLEFAKLVELGKKRELAQQKHHDSAEARHENAVSGGLPPETIEKIQNDLALM